MYPPPVKRSLYVRLLMSVSILFTIFLSGCSDSPSALKVACKEVATYSSECDADKAVLTLLTKYKAIAESFLLTHQPFIDAVEKLKLSPNYNKKLMKFEVLDTEQIRSLKFSKKSLLDLNATLNDGWFWPSLNDSVELQMMDSGLLVEIRKKSSGIHKLQSLQSICKSNIFNCRVSVSGVLDIVTDENGILLADDFSFEFDEGRFVERSVRDYLQSRLTEKSFYTVPQNSLSQEFSDFFQKAVEKAMLEINSEKMSVLSGTP